MNVFVVTSVPIKPPWDQGDKNLAFSLIRALPNIRFQVLTTPENRHTYPNLIARPYYRQRWPVLWQKVNVFRHLMAMSLSLQSGGIGEKPDLIHYIYRPNPLSSRILSGVSGLRAIPSIHTVPATADSHPIHPGLFIADKVVAISRFGQRKLVAAGLADALYIPSGIEVDEWAVLASRKDEFKNALGLGGKTIVLFPGHYGPGQGAQAMVQAVPLVIRQAPETQFIFACRLRSHRDQRIESEIRRRLQEAGCLENVHFFNTVSDMKTIIGASDILALPLTSMRDKLDIPTTILEAMAAGIPAVITNISPLNEIVLLAKEMGVEVGTVVTPGDAQELACAISNLAQNAAYRRRLGDNGLSHITQSYDIRIAAARYAELYNSLKQ